MSQSSDLQHCEAGDPNTVPEMIDRSNAAFERDLVNLLRTHYRKWVAYNGERQLGIARTETELYRKCLAMGLRPDEFVVRYIDHQMPDEMIELSPDA
jgi:hypothetical protein